MKLSPDDGKLDENLRSSALVAGGFMGDDPRSAAEIIQADANVLERSGITLEMLAERLRDLTVIAKAGLGNWVETEDGRLRVMCDECKGILVCPWRHAGRFAKRVTTAEQTDTGRTLVWTDLNLHLIEAHGFFEGRGSTFRIDPAAAVEFLFGPAGRERAE
ncbi:MAG: hypothetical protein ABR497_07955 [Kiritimatiellia bacterium]|nr:hypothetical protein [Lentisphaerota bacterium]